MRDETIELRRWLSKAREQLRRVPFWTWFLLVMIVGALLIWAVYHQGQEERVRRALEANFRREFSSLVEHLQQAQIWLEKAEVSSANQQALMLVRFAFKLEAAQAALAQLPVQAINLSESRKFLAQAADYATVLSDRLAQGDSLSDQERQQLERFAITLQAYGRALDEIAQQQNRPGFSWVDVYLGKKVVRQVRAKPEAPLLQSLLNLEEDLAKLPILVYDGPFSDQPNPRRPLGLEGDRITQQAAARIAREFARSGGAEPSGRSTTTPVAGDTAVYAVSLQENDLQIQADISQIGGRVIWYLHERMPQSSKLSLEEARKRAEEFLKRQGFRSMRPSYQSQQQHSLTMVFVAEQNGILLYPDQVKIQVALDNGQILAWDAGDYYMFHRQRPLQQPQVPRQQVVRSVEDADLPVNRIRLALIPSAGGMEEILAWEVETRWHGNDYLVYVNAMTGQQERILRLIHIQGGTLAQ